ncbi:MAG: hypothetical protein Q7R48_00120 [bacterium]|nr:hypothetical protein [bacterium]
MMRNRMLGMIRMALVLPGAVVALYVVVTTVQLTQTVYDIGGWAFAAFFLMLGAITAIGIIIVVFRIVRSLPTRHY